MFDLTNQENKNTFKSQVQVPLILLNPLYIQCSTLTPGTWLLNSQIDIWRVDRKSIVLMRHINSVGYC